MFWRALDWLHFILHGALRLTTVFKTAHSAMGSNGHELTPKQKVKGRISTAAASTAFSLGDFLSLISFVHLVNPEGCRFQVCLFDHPSIEPMEATCICRLCHFSLEKEKPLFFVLLLLASLADYYFICGSLLLVLEETANSCFLSSVSVLLMTTSVFVMVPLYAPPALKLFISYSFSELSWLWFITVIYSLLLGCLFKKKKNKKQT